MELEELKGFLEDYLKEHDFNLKRGGACPKCDGGHNTPCFHYNPKTNRVHCFSCEFDGDIFDLVALENNVSNAEAIRIVREKYEGKTPIKRIKLPIKRNETEEKQDFSSELTSYFKRVNETNYFKTRGFSDETIQDFKLGFNGRNAVIPFSKYSYLERGIGANNDYKHNHGGSPDIFNLQDLYNEEKQPVFICEGWADALSIYECNGYAIATNSTTNYKKLLDQLKKRPTSNPLIVAYDNDEKGLEYSNILLEELKSLQIPCKVIDYGTFKATCKDLNECLIADKTELTNLIKRETTGEFSEFSDPYKSRFNLDNILSLFEKEDTKSIELADFPTLTNTIKLKKHDTLVLGADTGAGKSSLALNWLNDLSKTYPVLYFNLEMDYLSVAKRLIAINSNTKLDDLADFNKEATKKIVIDNLKEIEARNPINVYNTVYNVEDIEAVIKANSQEHTIVIIDHVLLTRIKGNNSRYERFTNISETLRQIARNENITMILLCQQNRDGKKDEPELSSLKETGSIENDATHVVFIWYDERTDTTNLIVRKNRNGENNVKILLEYNKPTQKIQEAKAEDTRSKQQKQRKSR